MSALRWSLSKLFAAALLAVCATQTHAQTLDLGDMAVGGDGTGLATPGIGLQIYTGTLLLQGQHGQSGTSGNSSRFTKTDGTNGTVDLPFVDGVFVPNASTQINSLAETFQFPATLGWQYDGIRNAVSVVEIGGEIRPLRLRDRRGIDRRGIGMHSDSGITFDLDAIRDAGFSIVSSSGVAGLTEDTSGGSVDIYILVDGAVRFQTHIGSLGYMPFNVPLTNADRFLTFASTDDGSLSFDHSAFADAVLVLGCSGDLNGDLAITVDDIVLLLANYGQPGGYLDGDMDGNGFIDLQDLGILIGAYGNTCN